MQRIQTLLKFSIRCSSSTLFNSTRFRYTTDVGGGAGTGGSIREAGGSMGTMAAANEERYFYDLQRDQIEKMKKGVPEEANPKEQAKKHQSQASDDMYLAKMNKE